MYRNIFESTICRYYDELVFKVNLIVECQLAGGLQNGNINNAMGSNKRMAILYKERLIDYKFPEYGRRKNYSLESFPIIREDVYMEKNTVTSDLTVEYWNKQRDELINLLQEYRKETLDQLDNMMSKLNSKDITDTESIRSTIFSDKCLFVQYNDKNRSVHLLELDFYIPENLNKILPAPFAKT